MLRKIEFIVVLNLLLVFAAGVVLAASAPKPAGLVEKTVLIEKKFNTFDDSKLKEMRGKVDLANFDRMVGFIVVEAERVRDHSTYRFNGLTDVKGKDGEKMTMEDLVVPCRAKINFFPNRRKAPVLYSIEIVKTFRSGDRAWSERPQDQ